MERIELKVSASKSSIMTFLCLLFVCGGLYFFLNAENLSADGEYSSGLLKIIGSITISFFGIGLVRGIFNIINPNLVGLIIDERGIILSNKERAQDIISWRTITEFDEVKIQSSKLIMIRVNNPSKRIKENPNALKRFSMEMNKSSYGTPFSTSAATLEISHDELMELFIEKLKEYKESPV